MGISPYVPTPASRPRLDNWQTVQLLTRTPAPESAFAIRAPARYSFPVSTITAILEPDVDGTLHLPIPAEMRSARVKVTATLESVSSRPSQPEAIEALRTLSRLGTFGDIEDPVAWQRETREDRPGGSGS